MTAFLEVQGSDYGRRRYQLSLERRRELSQGNQLERVHAQYREILAILDMVGDAEVAPDPLPAAGKWDFFLSHAVRTRMPSPDHWRSCSVNAAYRYGSTRPP